MKKGFTLIEMIGVMVILSLLLLIIMPNVINYIKKGGDIKDKATKEILYTAAKKYMEDNKGDFKKDKYSTYCIAVKDLSEQGYVDSPITLSSSDKDITKDTSTSVKVTYDKRYKYDVVENCEEKINPTPVLSKGLTPIKYDEENSKWVVADKTKNDWYDYDEQKWANAVTLLPGITKNVGDEVAVDGTEASMMLVWIPRYEYKIEGDYGKPLDGDEATQSLPGEIEVNFVLRTKKGYDEVSEYRVHPAFTFGEQEVSGFWVGKFELSSVGTNLTTNNNLNCNTTSCTNAQNLRILPNVPSLRYNNVSNFWYGIKSIENTSSFGLSNIDIHMMKNSEWGAVAYLSQSKYGKYGNSDFTGVQKEVYINNSSSFYTGRSGGNVGGSTPINGTYTDQSSTTKDNTYGYYTYDGYLLSYNTNTKTETRDINKGAGASTTGNIYGIYDMSGGAYEYVMGAYGTEAEGVYSGRNSTYNSNFKGKYGESGENTTGVALPESKYYDVYANATNSSSNDGKLSCKNGNEYGICYGHAISETANWYGDSAYMVYKSYPWFVRGGGYNYDTFSGVFSHGNEAGHSYSATSARVVGFGK